MSYFQQGDTLYFPKAKIPKDAKLLESNVVQWGELTNHKHALHDGEFQLFETPKGVRFLRVVTPTALRHEEHHEIMLPPGEYKIGIVREYDPFEKLERRVMD